MPCCAQCEDEDCLCRTPYFDSETKVVTIFSNGIKVLWVKTGEWLSEDGTRTVEYERIHLSVEEVELLRQSIRSE